MRKCKTGHGDLAHHDGGRANLDIAAQDGEDPGMILDLIADQVRQGVADRTGQLADDDLRSRHTDDPPSLRPVPHPSAVSRSLTVSPRLGHRDTQIDLVAIVAIRLPPAIR